MIITNLESRDKHARQYLQESKEYAKFNITSNILELGAIKTGLYKKLSKKRKNLIRNIDENSLVDVSEIVGSINFIINNNSLNNSVIKLDKGL